MILCLQKTTSLFQTRAVIGKTFCQTKYCGSSEPFLARATDSVIMNLNERITYAAWMKARIESDPDREDQLRLMKGPAFDELKDRVINTQIARWESTQEVNDT